MNKQCKLFLGITMLSFTFRDAAYGCAKNLCEIRVYDKTTDVSAFAIYAYEGMTFQWLRKEAEVEESYGCTICVDANKRHITLRFTPDNAGNTVKELTQASNENPYLLPLTRWVGSGVPVKGDFVAGPRWIPFRSTLHKIEEDKKIPNFTLRYVSWGVQVVLLLGAVAIGGWIILQKRSTTRSKAKKRN